EFRELKKDAGTLSMFLLLNNNRRVAHRLMSTGMLSIFLLLNNNVSAETNMQSNVQLLVGASLSPDTAYHNSASVFEAVIVEQGFLYLGSFSQADCDGMTARVTKRFKGTLTGVIPLSLSAKRPPYFKAEFVPNKGDKMIFFSGGHGFASNQVTKILWSTPANEKMIDGFRKKKDAAP
ncbi:MAG: hypothetical protein FWE69_08480, partial [Clostridiales bacterium]|nr:hypothetical protein [Clostridiales bacterium]